MVLVITTELGTILIRIIGVILMLLGVLFFYFAFFEPAREDKNKTDAHYIVMIISLVFIAICLFGVVFILSPDAGNGILTFIDNILHYDV